MFTAPRRHWRRFLLGLTLLLCALTADRPASAEDQPSRLNPVRLQLKWKHQFQFAGYYAALEQGYYREAGLEVELLEAPSEGEPSDVVLRGDAEFGIGASDLALLRTRGKPVVALAAIYQHSPLVLLALKRSGIEHVHDLAGKPVSIESHAAELLAYLNQEDLPPERIRRIPHDFGVGPLINGRVAAISAYSTDEPFLLREAGLDYVTLNPRAGGIDFYGDTLYTTEEQIRRHPQRVRAFLDASLRGWKYALANPEQMIVLIRSKISRRHSREHLRFEAEQMQRLIMPDVVEIGYMNPGRWEYILETYSQLGMASSNASMQGFLYERHPRPDLRWLYVTLGGALALLVAISLLAARFYRMHRQVRREVAEREQEEQHLRTLEKRYRVLAEHGPFPIVITHLSDGRIRYINPMAARVFDLTREQALGLSVATFYPRPEDQSRFVRALQEQGFVRNYEVRLRSASGQFFWAALSASIIEFEGEPAAFVALMDITERKELESELEKLATTDDLTGLYNRRSFQTGSETAIRHARSEGRPLSLLLLDVDQFKGINDTHGHEIGDATLRQLATALQMVLRSDDVPARVGGEEFAVLLPNTDLRQAEALAERAGELISGQEINGRDSRFRLTVSIGIADLTPEVRSLSELLRRADAALYQAKARGRNRVVAFCAAEDRLPAG
jgi:diguanylate cyclase (GGDEF)-like protein/PAS domain S-box-containing protein